MSMEIWDQRYADSDYVYAMFLNTFLPQLDQVIVYAAIRDLILFLIGTGLTRNALKTVSLRPMVFGVLLWTLISVSSLFVILHIIM